MIKTISQADFAGRIISRYMTVSPDGQIPAEMLLASPEPRVGGETALLKSIRNIRYINQLITENNIFNIHIGFRFPVSVLGKAVRVINESAARHIGMLEKMHTAPLPRYHGSLPPVSAA